MQRNPKKKPTPEAKKALEMHEHKCYLHDMARHKRDIGYAKSHSPKLNKLVAVKIDDKTTVFINPAKKTSDEVQATYRGIQKKKLNDLRKSSQIPAL